MAVILRRQTKMAAVFRCISGLHHTSQNDPCNDAFFILAFRFPQHFLNFSGMDLSVLFPQVIPKATDELFHFFQFILIRLLMAAVHKGHFLPEGIFRNGFVADQHKFLNHICGNASFVRFDFHRFAVFIQNDLAFRQIEVHRTAFSSLSTQDLTQFFHFFQHRKDLLILCQQLRRTIFQNFSDRCISHSIIGIDDRFRDAVRHHFPLLVDFHDTA